MRPVFDETCSWYKGNLHTHTTVSDGLYTPEEAAEAYQKRGYHFLAITDHLVCSQGGWLAGLLTLPAVEFHDNHYRPGRVCHITGVGLQKPVQLAGDTPPGRIVEALKDAGAFVTLAHPAWSLMRHEDLNDITGYDAVEIWNTISQSHSGRGDSTTYLDVLAASGCLRYITAVDDVHFFDGDAFGGWVWVSAPELSARSLLAALSAGRFYASQGPRIRQIWVGEGRVRVACEEPVAAIRFMSNEFYNARRVVRGPVLEAEYTLSPRDRFLRVECEDDSGRRAWSQYLPLEDAR